MPKKKSARVVSLMVMTSLLIIVDVRTDADDIQALLDLMYEETDDPPPHQGPG